MVTLVSLLPGNLMNTGLFPKLCVIFKVNHDPGTDTIKSRVGPGAKDYPADLHQ